MSENRDTRPLGIADMVLRVAIVALTLATAYIHLTLGGLLFTLNGIGYAVGAAAMVVPIGIAVRHRWLIRIGIAGYAAATIAGWVLDPVFYSTAYLAKAIEVALIALLASDFVRRDGGQIARIRREIRSLLGPLEGPTSGRA
jgi:hypothetical protein